MNESELISHALGQRKDAVFFAMSEALAKAYPDRAVVETEAGAFEPPSRKTGPGNPRPAEPFDRKYTFNLPDEECRAAYLKLQSDTIRDALQLTRDEVATVANVTEDFSYAYLKELVLSSMMKWFNVKGTVPMADIMGSQVESLRGQMQTPESEVVAGPENLFPPQMQAFMSRWKKPR